MNSKEIVQDSIVELPGQNLVLRACGLCCAIVLVCDNYRKTHGCTLENEVEKWMGQEGK